VDCGGPPLLREAAPVAQNWRAAAVCLSVTTRPTMLSFSETEHVSERTKKRRCCDIGAVWVRNARSVAAVKQNSSSLGSDEAGGGA
jgi:hypothetical protein